MKIEWRETPEGIRPFADEQEIGWTPQSASQMAFLECPHFECLMEGSRGSGKTDALLMSFASHCGLGYGAEWRGILFRQTYKQLADVVAKTKKWFHQIFPDPVATFNESKMAWTWRTGESLQLSYMEREDDYWNYHGASFPWVGWEELTTWPDDKCYKVMMSCCRSILKNMPRMYRSTSNPYGPGHNWVKARFELKRLPPGEFLGPDIQEPGLPLRTSVCGRTTENQVLLRADPEYISRIREAARNPAEEKAWIEGDWDVVAGGMFDDLWRPEAHVIPDIDVKMIPAQWRLNRSYDHGQSRPFSVGWWAESNGEPIEVGGKLYGGVRGDLFRLSEWYGWNRRPNEGLRMLSSEIADEILRRERELAPPGTFKPGPADSSIFDDFEPGKSVAGEMLRRGVRWTPSDKRPGSRKQGWDQIRSLLKGALPTGKGPREKPGMFICRRCDQFLRTFPVLPRSEKDPDDVDTDAEDHVADEVRYRLREKVRVVGSVGW